MVFTRRMTQWGEPAPPPPGTAQLATEERNWAMAANLGSFAAAWFGLGLLAPLGVLLYKGGGSPFVRRHSIESLNFQINALIWTLVCVVLWLVLIGILLLLMYAVFYVICVVLAAVRASAGEDYRYPLTIRFIS